MAGSGRISLLIDSPLRTVTLAMRGLDGEVRKQINSHTKRNAEPMWKEATRANADNRLQTRVLADTARVGVTDLNVTLRAGGAGRLSSGTSTGILSAAVAFGANPGKLIATRSRAGRQYKRKQGAAFNRPRRGGYVVYPAAREVIPRIASLRVQTVIRTVHEAIEKVSG
jgi:hypothetical protein